MYNICKYASVCDANKHRKRLFTANYRKKMSSADAALYPLMQGHFSRLAEQAWNWKRTKY